MSGLITDGYVLTGNKLGDPNPIEYLRRVGICLGREHGALVEGGTHKPLWYMSSRS